MNGEGMTRTERNDLISLARRRARVAKQDAKVRAATLTAKVEEQLSAVFKSEDDRWNDARRRVQAEVEAMNQRIAAQLLAEGLPERLHPRAEMGWSGRGENARASRRAELRLLAKARINEQLQTAVAEIERSTVQLEADMLAVTSGAEARNYLLGLPSAEALLPSTVAETTVAELTGGSAQ